MKNYIGIDLGDKFNIVCILNKKGEEVETVQVENSPASMKSFFEKIDKSPIVIEAGTHSFWVSKLLISLKHNVFVCNPRKLDAVTKNIKKSDYEDALILAQMLLTGKHLLKPVYHGELKAMKDFLLIKSRAALVKSRTSLINHVRGVVKSLGERVPTSLTSDAFHLHAGEELQEETFSNVEDLINAIGLITSEIKKYDQKINKLVESDYPAAQLLQSVKGVGPITSLAFVLTIGDPKRFKKSRDVGAYLGLVPRRDQSGDTDNQCSITKAGNTILRTLLINCANHILGVFGQDNQIRAFGLKILGDGSSKIKKRKAKVAVARKLSVILHQLWLTGKPFEPVFPENTRSDAKPKRKSKNKSKESELSFT